MWDTNAYTIIRNNPDMVCWEDFAKGKNDFPEYPSVSVPIQYGDSEHQFWNGYFKRYFGKEYVHFDFIIRVLSSFMLAA